MSRYSAAVNGADTTVLIEKEGLSWGEEFLDFADISAFHPVHHRVWIDTAEEEMEISMLGFSYEGFWKELMDAFGARSLASLFVEGSPLMVCEGEYAMEEETGRVSA